MITENLSTLKIHKLTRKQYERELEAGRLDKNVIYLTPYESEYATQEYVDNKIAEIPTPDVSGQIGNHNTATDSHNDIRLLVQGLTTRLNALADSDDTTLDQMSELVAYIKSNKTLIEEVTTNKVNVSDIIDDLTTNVANKPLSAAQGVALKALIDAITVPTKVSELTNDSGYITGYTETDPTVPAWAKASTKPTYTKSEIGLGNVDNVKQYSANNPPPYPVTSVNGVTGAVTVNVPTSLKNPNSITFTGAVTGSYDGSSAVTINVPTVAGDPGYSPVRGKDYWTDADKAEIKAYVDEAILGGVW